MPKRLDVKFIKSIVKNVEDCSTPIQLRTYLKKYEAYVFSQEIENVFRDRIAFFKEWFRYDKIEMAAIEDIEDTLDVDIMISASRKKLFDSDHRKNHKKEVRSYVSDSTKGVKKL